MSWIFRKLLSFAPLARIFRYVVGAIGAFLISIGVDVELVNAWVSSTVDLLLALAPIVVAIILDWLAKQQANNDQVRSK